MFVLNESVDAMSSVPEEFRPFYEEKDGKALLRKDDPIISVAAKTVNGLAGALKNSRTEADNWKKKVGDWKGFEEFGDNPASVHENVTKTIAELKASLASKKDVNVDEIKKGIAESMKSELTKRDATISQYRTALEEHLVKGAAVQSLAKFEGSVKLALPHVLSHLKIVEDNGKFEVQVVDDNGNQRFSHSSPGDKMGVEEYVGEMSKSEEYGPLFKSQAKSGGGADSAHRTQGRHTQGGSGLSPIQKIAANLPR